MLKIFAKQGTEEKALVYCKQEDVGNVQSLLNEKYGGNWVWVDKLHTHNEILLFNDGLKYLGFHGKNERYCQSIKTIKP